MTLRLPAPLAVEDVADRAGIAALSVEWERLRAEVSAAGGTSGPFLSPAWFAVWASAIAPRPRILVAHRGGRVMGLLPLLWERRRLAGMPARVLRSLSDNHSQRFDVLLSPSEPQPAAAALWRHLRRLDDWDAIELREIPDGPSGAARLCAEAQAGGHHTGARPAMRSPFIELSAGVERLGSAKFRANLRRRKKKLEAEVGPLTLERVEARGPELEAALDEGLALEKAGWKGAKKSAIACDPRLRRRYLQLARSFQARGQLALCFLRAGGRRVAFHFAMIEEGVYFLFKPGFDPQLSHYGLGHLLVEAVIQGLPGLRELDLLGDDMPWKREWTPPSGRTPGTTCSRAVPTGARCGAWKLDLAPQVKRILKR